MQRFNTAIVQEEMLVDIVHVIEHDWPVGPRFIYALGSLVEAFTIHDTVYFDPLRYTERNDLGGNDPHSIIASSDFVKNLINAGGLQIFPERDSVNELIENENIDYDFTDFLINSAWRGASFLSANPESEAGDYHNLLDLMGINKIFEETDFNIQSKGFGEFGVLTYSNPIVMSALKLGFNKRDIEIIESYNRRSAAYLSISNKLGMNLYSTLNSLPHQFGSIRSYNGKAREMYKDINTKIVELDDDELSKDDFSRISIPPLLAVVLEKSKDDSGAIVDEMCEMRRAQQKFRNYLTAYEREWIKAHSRTDRRRLRNEFENAWKHLNETIDAPATRIIYQVWEIFRSPTELLQSIGDKLSSKGKELSIIHRVAGLHDFNQTLMNSPLPNRNREILGKLFDYFQPQDTWAKALVYTAQLNNMLEATANNAINTDS